MGKSSAQKIKRRNQRSTLASTPLKLGPDPVRKGPERGRYKLFLPVIRIQLVLFLALLTITSLTIVVYGDTMASELNSLPHAYWWLYLSLLGLGNLVSIGIIRIRDVHKAKVIVKVKVGLTILTIAVALYPSIVFSGLSDRVLSLIIINLPKISDGHARSIQSAVEWFLAGIGGWIGNIVLGALGSGLWTFVSRYVRRDRSA